MGKTIPIVKKHYISYRHIILETRSAKFIFTLSVAQKYNRDACYFSQSHFSCWGSTIGEPILILVDMPDRILLESTFQSHTGLSG